MQAQGASGKRQGARGKGQGASGKGQAASGKVTYWAVYRRALRKTKKNKGWMFVTYYHGTVKMMQSAMRAFGWFQPAFKIEPLDGDEGRALAIADPEYSFMFQSVVSQIHHAAILTNKRAVGA